MRTPKVLPWLARKAGVSDTRAADLWFDAIRYATDVTGWVGTPEYWRVANERWLELLDTEKQQVQCATRSHLPVVASQDCFPPRGLPQLLLCLVGTHAGPVACR